MSSTGANEARLSLGAYEVQVHLKSGNFLKFHCDTFNVDGSLIRLFKAGNSNPIAVFPKEEVFGAYQTKYLIR